MTRPISADEHAMVRALLLSLLLHVLAALAWQPPPPTHLAEATVLRAVLLPALQARPEAESPPPVPARRPDAMARPTRAEGAAAPGFSEVETASAPSAPPAQRTAALTTSASPVAAAPAGASGGAEITQIPAQPAPERLAATVSALAASRLAAPPAETRAVTAPAGALAAEEPGRSVMPPSPPPAATRLVSAATVAGRAESMFTAGTAGLAEAPAGLPAPGGSPAAAPAVLRPAGAGRALPVLGASGANEFVEYADDNPAFVYPRQAARLGLQGTVLLEVEVEPDGRPGAIHIQRGSGHALLDQDALRQMATWRFKPAARLGRPHAARVVVPIHYRLHDSP